MTDPANIRCVRVVREVKGGVEVMPLQTGCDHCERAGGCQGAWLQRVLPIGRSFVLAVPAKPGQRLMLSVQESALQRTSCLAYGSLLGGLLLGASVATGLGEVVGVASTDLVAILGAVIGLWLAQRFCRRLPVAGIELHPEA